MRSNTLKLVITDLELREKKGLSKYKTTVDRTDLTNEQWLQHAYEEALDMAMYLKRAMTSPDQNAKKPSSVMGWLAELPQGLFSKLQLTDRDILEWPCRSIEDALAIVVTENKSKWKEVVKIYNKTGKFPTSLDDIS